MSQSLLQFAKDFVAGKISAEQFADPYQAKWKAERDSGALSKDQVLL
ncbi:colicin immunity domain-containing protein [Pantoea sp. LMR881]|nr:colicin immunity domain-containing protein [Pantoea sp. LMR881]MCZ4061154.1 colicin immunity domain-containing protein [Pantoea sp. LMR881]